MSDLPIPDIVLLHHCAVLGKTGSGKTSTAKLMVERIVSQGGRVCVLDSVKSDWWGMISSADGKKPGLPFRILGGPHGHVPLHSSAGAAIGEIVAKGDLPLSIIDMADFEAGGLQRFFVDFAPALLRHMRGVVHLVLEEAHEFAPKERSGIGKENMAIHYAKKLATAGRSKGVRLIVATQRTQSLHNALLGSCETVIAHRMTAPADQTPVLKWLEANAGKQTMQVIRDTLAGLRTGTGWLCSGEAGLFKKVAFPRISTFDNSATPTGDDAQRDVVGTPVDIKALHNIIGEAVKEAEANDPKSLKGRIAELERELKAGGGISPEQLEAARDAGHKAGVAVGFREGLATVDGYMQAVEQAVDSMAGIVAGLRHTDRASWIEQQLRIGPTSVSTPQSREQKVTSPAPAVSAKPSENMMKPILGGNNGALQSGARKLLAVLAGHSPAKLTWGQTATLAGLKPRGGHFNAAKKQLSNMGYIESEGGTISASDAGMAAAGDVKPAAATPEEVQELWIGRLPSPANEMLRYLCSGSAPISRKVDFMADELGKKPRGGHWNSGLATLRRNGLIVQEGASIRAADILFEVQ